MDDKTGEELRKLLLAHKNRYPEMQVTDAVKLLYQGEFGGGHLIKNPLESLKRIQEEWGGMKPGRGRREEPPCGPEPLYESETPCESELPNGSDLLCEPIGGGMCRMNLAVLDQGLAPETLNRMFVKTAEGRSGDMAAFLQKLDLLVQWCREDDSLFPVETVMDYLEDYRKQGCPAVSHSETYRQLYQPAYRVTADSYGRYWSVFAAIDQALKESGKSGKDQVWVAIDGMCGSGKSTMGRILKEIYGCNLFHMDDFFLQPWQRNEERLNEPGGNVDYERFQAEILDHGNDREGISYQIYDCSRRQLGEWVTVPWKRLNIVEGSYSQHPYFKDRFDLRFFCWIGKEEQLRRIRERNGEGMLRRFTKEWIPMENRYFETFGIREKSIEIRGER